MSGRFVVALSMVVGFIFSSPAAAETPRDFTGYALIRVTVNSQYELDQITQIVESVWTDYPGIGELPVLVSPEQRRALESAGYKFEVQIDDVQPLITRQMESGGRSDWDHYMNLSEIIGYINNLAVARPDLCQVFSIGKSIENRDLWVLHITGAPGGNKPAVFYQSLIHAREWISGPCVLYLANHLVTNYDTDPAVKNLVDKLDIYLMPCVNPDGYHYTWTVNRDWRKNRRNNGDGSYGVDLNRNWAYGWGGPGASGVPSSLTYYGTAPFSEPESAAIRDFLVAHPNVVAHMDYHSYSQLILWPFGNECVGGPPEPDGSEFAALGATMSARIQAVHNKYYEPGPICETIYQASGGSTDWVYADRDIFGFTIELRDTGQYGFLLPPEQILPTCQENLPAILHLTQWAAEQISTQITLFEDLPEILAPGTPTELTVRLHSIGEYVVPGSPTFHYRYNGGEYLTTPLADLGNGAYAATLPAARCDDIPEFYFSAAGDISGIVRLPAGAPADVFALPVGEIVTVFEDDFNQHLGWTVQNSTSLTDGAWERGIPITSCSRGNPQSDYDGSGWCYLTDNANQADCNTDVDGGYTWLISPTIDLSDGDAEISFALWYTNDYGADPNNDLFKIYVSNNNGTNWTLVETVGPQTPGNAWFPHSFKVSDFVIPNAQVRVRFEASDLGSGSVVEAGIDAFKVRRMECDEPQCPGDLDGDGDVDLSDLAQLLANYGTTAGAAYEDGDLDGDGDVDLSDLAALLAVYNTSC